MEISNRINALRKALEMNQLEFAKCLGVKQATISAIELGKSSVTEKNIKMISAVFGVNEEWLRDGKGEMFVKPDDIEAAVLKIFRELSDEGRKEVLNFIEYILKKQKAEIAGKNVVG